MAATLALRAAGCFQRHADCAYNGWGDLRGWFPCFRGNGPAVYISLRSPYGEQSAIGSLQTGQRSLTVCLLAHNCSFLDLWRWPFLLSLFDVRSAHFLVYPRPSRSFFFAFCNSLNTGFVLRSSLFTDRWWWRWRQNYWHAFCGIKALRSVSIGPQCIFYSVASLCQPHKNGMQRGVGINVFRPIPTLQSEAVAHHGCGKRFVNVCIEDRAYSVANTSGGKRFKTDIRRAVRRKERFSQQWRKCVVGLDQAVDLDIQFGQVILDHFLSLAKFFKIFFHLGKYIFVICEFHLSTGSIKYS